MPKHHYAQLGGMVLQDLSEIELYMWPKVGLARADFPVRRIARVGTRDQIRSDCLMCRKTRPIRVETASQAARAPGMAMGCETPGARWNTPFFDVHVAASLFCSAI